MLDSTKLERLVRGHFWSVSTEDIEDIVSEARTIQLKRYGTLLDDQAKCHCRDLILEAARNLGLLNKEVNIAGNNSERVIVRNRSFEVMQENGFDPAADECFERPEVAIERVLQYLPDGPMKQVFEMLLNEDVESIDSAASSLSLTPQRVFDALRKIGKLMSRYDELSNGLFQQGCDDRGLRSAIARICDSLTPRSSQGESWEQSSLFPA